VGSAALGWFDPKSATGKYLSQDFEHFYYPGNTYSLSEQISWLQQTLSQIDSPVFVFLNVGETHVPYYFSGAPWDGNENPCIPFAKDNDATKCRERQTACLEYVDQQLQPLINAFADANTVITADHGDCWGEDGLWEHGIHHEKVLEVPLLFRLNH
jgi:hypothetical protein